MKVACLTCFVPRHENVKGPSGLLYQTLKWRPAHVSVTVFVFGQPSEAYRDLQEVMELAAAGICFVTCPIVPTRPIAPRHWPLGARNIAQAEIPNLDAFNAVWAYPYWFAPFMHDSRRPVLISGMDCATLLYWRKIKNTPIMPPSRFLRAAAGLAANAFFEFRYMRRRHVHVVGQEDARTLQRAGVRTTYIPHPFLAYPPVHRPAYEPARGLTFLLSNPGDPIYGSPRYLRWVRTLLDRLRDEVAVRLIVHKGAPDALRAIDAAARNHPRVAIDPVTWVNDYGALLSTVDIQLFPLDIGAGTKTSVLTALQHGVRVICSPIAAENVQANPFSFVVDDSGTSFADALSQAIASVKDGVAPPPLVDTLAQHSPRHCSSQFWNHLEHHVD
jgi:hypothetical protein